MDAVEYVIASKGHPCMKIHAKKITNTINILQLSSQMWSSYFRMQVSVRNQSEISVKYLNENAQPPEFELCSIVALHDRFGLQTFVNFKTVCGEWLSKRWLICAAVEFPKRFQCHV